MSKLKLDLLELGKLVDDGKTTKELAKHFDVSVDTIRRRKKELDKLRQKEKEKMDSPLSKALNKLVEKENQSYKPINSSKTIKYTRLPSKKELGLDSETDMIRKMRSNGISYKDIANYTGLDKRHIKEVCEQLIKDGKLIINKAQKKLNEEEFTKIVNYDKVLMQHKIVSIIIGEHRYTVDRSKWNDGLALVCVLAFVQSNKKFSELVFSGIVSGNMATSHKLLHGNNYIMIGQYYIRTDNTSKDCALLIDKVCTEVLDKKVRFEVR